MPIVKSIEAPLASTWLGWIAREVSDALSSIKPKHTAADVAAAVAGSGNPAGV